jgi:oxygen-independent coproporphyrinogen-3 oxidase
MKTSVYIHIPFCRQKCAYCDFLSFPMNVDGIAGYLKALRLEVMLRAQELKQRGMTVDTLYIGGGTPTVLAAAELDLLLSHCCHHLPLHHVEWTVEANPCTIDHEKVKILADYGINRISLGVQDTFDGRLALLGRTHSAAQARQAFSLVRNTFKSVSLDIMTGLPGQSVDHCVQTLGEISSWQPDHISMYGLKVEEDTRLGRLVQQGAVTLPSEDDALDMMERGQNILSSQGYHQYEIANFARLGHQCRHNRTYWENRPYLGMGLGAHSYWDGSRQQNTVGLKDYATRLGKGELPVTEINPVTRRQAMEDTMMLGLRLIDGVTFTAFAERFGCDLRDEFAAEINRLSAMGLIHCNNSSIRLSTRGLPLANLVFAEFITVTNLDNS